MPLVDLILDPFGEFVLQDCSADVGDPLLGRLRELDFRLRQEVVHLFMVGQEVFLDLFDAEAFISKVD